MKILLIEDDPELRASICQELLRSGWAADCGSDGEEAMLYALNPDYGYDLVIMDRMLPVIDGLTVVKAMRRKGIETPVILITGMTALENRIDGLDGGADDYLIKPFHIRELLARVRALVRRPHELQAESCLIFSDLKLDCAARQLSCAGQTRSLTARETDLLSALLRQPETVFSREQLVWKVWGSDSDIEPGNVDNYISFLRKRLRELNSKCVIRTIYGTGYRLEADHA